MSFRSIFIVTVVLVGALLYIERANAPTPEPTEKVSEDTEQAAHLESATGKQLDLSGQGLTKVPENIFDQTGTEILDLSHNSLTGALPAEIRHLTRLKALDLSDNKFTGVPAEIGQLADLEILDLSNNPITGLPYELGNLKKLKLLDLRGTSYAVHDLEIIKQGVSHDVEIKTD